MTQTTEACIRGCGIPSQHLTDCPGTTDDGEDCSGCLPQRATNGHLCGWCHRRFEMNLTDAPTVARWLTGNLAAEQGAAMDDMRVTSSGDGPPLPLRAAIYDARQLLTDRLTLYATQWAASKGITPPDPHTALTDAAFLLLWLRGVESLDQIGAWWDGLDQTLKDAHTVAPWRPKTRRIPGVPCPGCEKTKLVIYGGESDVTCQSCKIVMTEERFDQWERVLKIETGVAV